MKYETTLTDLSKTLRKLAANQIRKRSPKATNSPDQTDTATESEQVSGQLHKSGPRRKIKRWETYP
jgi:hypothetical protein